MKSRHVMIISVAALLLAGFVLTGCAGTATLGNAPSPTGGSIGASSVAPAAGASSTATSAGGASGTTAANGSAGASSGTKKAEVSKEDLTAIRKQLDAMQKEIDSLSMPSDNDFNGAAGAVY